MNQRIILPKKFRTPKKVLGKFLKYFLLLILIFWGFFFWKWSKVPTYQPGSPNSLVYCYHDTNTGMLIDWDCIKKTVGIVLDRTSTRDFMDFLTSSGTPEIIQNNCHAIAHNIGAKTFDLSSSMENALAKCTNSCGAGCIHGAIGEAVLKDLGEPYSSENIEHASAETIEKMGQKYCSRGNPMCHAVGHILYISSQSYTGALTSCNKISSGERKESCYNWVFMQWIGGESEWIFSGEQKSSPLIGDLGYPCSLAHADQLHACFHYLPLVQNQLFRIKNLHDSQLRDQMANKNCETFPMPGRTDCFEGIWFFVDNIPFPNEAPIDIDKRCESPQTLDDREACTRWVVWNYMYRLEYDPLLAYCEKITEKPRKHTCYSSMFDTILDGEGAKDPKEICKEYASLSCQNEYDQYIKEST
jgi:hypothetical protein